MKQCACECVCGISGIRLVINGWFALADKEIFQYAVMSVTLSRLVSMGMYFCSRIDDLMFVHYSYLLAVCFAYLYWFSALFCVSCCVPALLFILLASFLYFVAGFHEEYGTLLNAICCWFQRNEFYGTLTFCLNKQGLLRLTPTGKHSLHNKGKFVILDAWQPHRNISICTWFQVCNQVLMESSFTTTNINL